MGGPLLSFCLLSACADMLHMRADRKASFAIQEGRLSQETIGGREDLGRDTPYGVVPSCCPSRKHCHSHSYGDHVLALRREDRFVSVGGRIHIPKFAYGFPELYFAAMAACARARSADCVAADVHVR